MRNHWPVSVRFLLLLVLLIPQAPVARGADHAATRAALVLKHTDLLSVFIDCPRCDMQFIREQIPFVNHVRDKELSDIHLLIIPHHAGTSGTNYQIAFVGNNQFAGMNNSLTYWAPGTNSWDDTRRELTNLLKLGLAPYLANTPLANHLALSVNPQQQIERQPDHDPWRGWIFEVYAGANIRREETQSYLNARYGAEAEKITETWRFRLRPYFNHSERRFATADQEIHTESHRHGFESFAIRSLTDHLSVGTFFYIYSSTFDNIGIHYNLSPAVEYSIFPYREASSRAITFSYRIGYTYNVYEEETIFGKTSEYLLRHSLNASVRYQQTWGSIRAGLSGSHYFHDLDANRAELWARINLRLFSGFSVNLNGNFDLTNDQLSLRRGSMTLEEILLQQSRQASSYNVYASLGLSYTFGSKFTNVVNNRFR